MTTYSGTSSNDSIIGSQGDDIIHRLGGIDTIIGEAGNDLIDLDLTEWDWAGDSIDGGSGNDTIYGSGGIDTLLGGDGDDEIFPYQEINSGHSAGDSYNIIDAGKGNDTIHLSFTNNTIYFRKGDGQDRVVSGWWGNALNTIEFKDGTKLSDLAIRHQNSDLVIAIKNASDQITLKDFYNQTVSVGHLTFQDETSIDLEQILKQASDKQTQGTLANDALTGSTSFEFMEGLGGDDKLVANTEFPGQVLSGGAGNDTLDSGATNSILIGGTGDDLYIVGNSRVVLEHPDGGTDRVVMSNFYSVLPDNIEQGILTDSPDYLYLDGNNLDNLLEGNAYDNHLMSGWGGSDTLQGHAGQDTLTAVGGDDTYVFRVGDGQDVIESAEFDAINHPNTLQITGIASILSEIGFDPMGDALGIFLTGTDSITIEGFFVDNNPYNPINPVQRIYFPELNITWNLDTLTTLITGDNTLFGTDDDDTLTGTGSANGLYGQGGNDTLTGANGGDTLDGGTGADQMAGRNGNDVYRVDDDGDVVTENPGEGTDLVIAMISCQAPENIENVSLSGQDDLSVTGNDLANRLFGNAGDNMLDGAAGRDTLVGGVGDDTYFVDASGDEVIEAADQGVDQVISLVSYTLGNNIENLALNWDGGSNATGNALNNQLTGNGFDNILTGAAGNDTLAGGGGNDTLIGGAGDDTYFFYENDGQITIRAEVDTRIARREILDLQTFTDNESGNLVSRVTVRQVGMSLVLSIDGTEDSITIEGFFATDGSSPVQEIQFGDGGITWGLQEIQAILAIRGTAGNDVLKGTSGGDRILGLAGNDTIDSGAGNDTLDGGTGNDVMNGGIGNDTYYVDALGDKVNESVNAGTDLVITSITYTAPTNVENVSLNGSADLKLSGNTLTNKLIGNGGNNILDGAAGADTLVGGAGNDTYTVDVAGDVVKEDADQGVDTILSAVTYTASANVENLTLTGSAAINATGNALANTLTGNGGNNVLDGGAGNDTLVGGKGNDTYVVDAAGDVVTEKAGEGTDLIQASVSYTASANVENLTLTGSAAINATGNALVNTLTGNGADNVLDGGAGADKLIGGAGNDTYIVDIAGDTVTEGVGQGIDLILSAVAYTASANVENLTLTGSAGVKATGNALDNVLTGNSGANALDGAAGNDTLDGGAGNDSLTGGVGADFLTGGAGSDLFVFAAGSTVLTIGGSGNAGTLTGYDRISDFALGFVTGAQDKIDTIGAPFVVADTKGSDGKDSVLTIGGQAIKSHAIKDGMITFDDVGTYAAPINLGSLSDVAAVVQYLQGNILGKAGASVAFDADTGGVHHTFLFTQGDATGANNTLDVLVDLVGVDAGRLAAATAGMTASTLLIG